MTRGRNKLARALVVCFAALMAFAAVPAIANETREEYKADVEPICKTNKEASDKYLKGVRKLVKQDKLKQAGTSFAKAAAALEKAQKQLAAVPQPPADSAKLDKWLSMIKSEVALMRKISGLFKAGKKSKATSEAVKLQNEANKANNLVVVFSFNYCKIDPSKYT